MKVYLKKFADGLGVSWQRKDDSKGFGLSDGKGGGALLFNKEGCGKSRPGSHRVHYFGPVPCEMPVSHPRGGATGTIILYIPFFSVSG